MNFLAKITVPPAVIVVDMINDYLEPEGLLYCQNCRRIIPNLKLLLEFSRNREWPVYYVNTCLDNENQPLAVQWGLHACRGTRGAKIVDDLAPRPGDKIIEKATYDGFYNTNLETELKKAKTQWVIVCGIHTHVCVLMTAVAAFNRGYKVLVLGDCMISDKTASHESRLPFYGTHVVAPEIGRLLSLEDLFEQNNGR